MNLGPQDMMALLDQVQICLPFSMIEQMERGIVFTDSGFWKYSVNVIDTTMLMSDAALSEGSKTMGIQ